MNINLAAFTLIELKEMNEAILTELKARDTGYTLSDYQKYLIRGGYMIQAIKDLRDCAPYGTQRGLKDCKDACEAYKKTL